MLVTSVISAAGLAACGSSASHAAATSASATSRSGSSVLAAGLQRSYVSVTKRVAPAMVQISTPQGLGSGVVFDGSGDIVTDAHVVAGGRPLRVTDAMGRSDSATLVGKFVADDLAVVRARGASLHRASFVQSNSLQVGDIVLALDNPLGLRSSVTNGIISALGRTVNEPNGVVLPDVIQTSAPINPGNSGGALVDLQGKVVGIPTLAATDPQLGGGAALRASGSRFPARWSARSPDKSSNTVTLSTRVARTWAVDLATGATSGAVVVAVQSGSPKARAGIVRGDTINSFDGQAASNAATIGVVLARLKPGQTVPVALVQRDGSQRTVRVTLAQYPGSTPER